MDYKLLNKINFPSDLRNISKSNLNDLAKELRQKTIQTVSKTGGASWRRIRSCRINHCCALCFQYSKR